MRWSRSRKCHRALESNDCWSSTNASKTQKVERSSTNGIFVWKINWSKSMAISSNQNNWVSAEVAPISKSKKYFLASTFNWFCCFFIVSWMLAGIVNAAEVWNCSSQCHLNVGTAFLVSQWKEMWISLLIVWLSFVSKWVSKCRSQESEYSNQLFVAFLLFVGFGTLFSVIVENDRRMPLEIERLVNTGNPQMLFFAVSSNNSDT